jgi:hypothetical protein
MYMDTNVGPYIHIHGTYVHTHLCIYLLHMYLCIGSGINLASTKPNGQTTSLIHSLLIFLVYFLFFSL